MRILSSARFYVSQVMKMSALAADSFSLLRFSTDLLLVRLLSLFRIQPSNRLRKVRLGGGVSLTYRLNSGDLQSIREIWLDEAYRLPFQQQREVLVDLGANIGLTSLWLAKKYGFSTILAVEPVSSNAALARMNLSDNGVKAEVIEAAVGPSDGTVLFQESNSSNFGHVSSTGRPVRSLSMDTLLGMLPGGRIDVMKMDIEGGEEALLRGDMTWASHVGAIIAEFHPTIIDYPGAIQILRDSGFRYIPANSAHKDSMDAFVKDA